MQVNTEKYAVMCLVAFFIGYVWATFFPQAPYLILVEAVGGSLALVAGKRLTQKLKTFQNGQETAESERTTGEDK